MVSTITAENSCASGDRMTSNIGTNLAPVHAAAGSDGFLGGLDALRQGGRPKKWT